MRGDERSYEFAISLRAVTSEAAMTAGWARLPCDFPAQVSNAILNGVKDTSQVAEAGVTVS